MVTTIVPPTLASGGTVTYAPAPQGTAYKYDRLNRLKSSKAWQDVDAVGNLWATGDGSSYAGMYENNFSYDANGNITAQMRKDATGTYIDTLTYQYAEVNGRKVQNRLYHVNDGVSNTAFTDDIDDQGTFINSELVNSDNNYGYDEIGNLNRNNQKEIAEMVYNVTGKVKEVRRTVGSNKENLKFDYDANGNRIAKHVYTSDDVWMKSDYYVNDAQGNNMAIYTLTGSSGAGLSYQLAERNIFGSSRVGTNKTAVELIAATTPTDEFIHTLGDRHFNLMNFRNDVLTTITDQKIPVEDDQNPGTIAYYNASIVRISDTYLYGMPQPERSFGVAEGRLGYQTQEMVNEINGKPATHYTADYWEYNALTARRENNDPVVKPFESPYLTFGGNPIYYSDVLGNTVEGATEEDAQQSKQEISNAFNNNKNFDQFFKLGEDGKTFEKIKLNDFNKFLTKESGFNEKQKALARGLVKTINASYKITVKFDDSFIGGELKPTSKTTAIAEIGLANSYMPFGGSERLPSNRTAIFIHEVIGEGRVLGNTGDFNTSIDRRHAILDNGGSSDDFSKDPLLRKLNLEIIQTENLYNSYRINGFLRSGIGDHDVPIKDQNKIGLIPNQLNSLYYVTGEALESGNK